MIKLELFDSLLEPVFVLDQNTQVQYCNEAAALLCGNTLRKILRQKSKLTEILIFDEIPDWLNQISTVVDPTPYKEIAYQNTNSVQGRIQLTAQLISEANETPMWLVFTRDVTLEERLQNKYRGELEQKEGIISELQKAQAELQNYSKNLETMVEERTYEVKELNVQMKALLDSLSQGFLIFNKDGDCLPVFSKACETTLEKSPYQQKIWDVLSLDETEIVTFKKWTDAMFSQLMPFEDLKPLGPEYYAHSQGRRIALDYFPLLNWSSSHDQQIQGVVLVASDITDLRAAQERAAKEAKSAQFILSLVQKQSEIGRFVSDAQKMISQIRDVATSNQLAENSESLLRWVHTLKGGSGSFTIDHVVSHCHEAETLLLQLEKNSSAELLTKINDEIRNIDVSFTDFLNEARQILGPKAFS